MPPFGYRVFRLIKGEPTRPTLTTHDSGSIVETDSLIVEFDKGKGCIKRLFDKASGKELCRPSEWARLEARTKNASNMNERWQSLA